MTEKQILKGNKLIAEFMNVPFNEEERKHSFSGHLPMFNNSDHSEWCDSEYRLDHVHYLLGSNLMLYNKSWDWLMPVIEKIESLGYWFRMDFGDVFILDDDSNIIIENPMHEDGYTKISISWLVVLRFINWYKYLRNPYKIVQ